MTVEAAFSKHRRRDLLPIHPELVAMLREWLEDLTEDQVIFPKLGKRRTWLMVKLDLERVGIAYETPEGIADFHAAGRHTHITELLRNGATLPEAKELARHSDVKMTMKYAHIGIADQARALRQLPWNGESKREATPASANDPSTPHADTWERSGSESDGPGRHGSSSGDNSQPTHGAQDCDIRANPDSTCRQPSHRVASRTKINRGFDSRRLHSSLPKRQTS